MQLRNTRTVDFPSVPAPQQEEAGLGGPPAADHSTIPETLVFNGIDAETGKYGLSPMTLPELAELARVVTFLEGRPLLEDQSAHELSEAGWGVVFPRPADEAVRAALEPLLAMRREQSGDRFRELSFQPGDGKDSFLRRYGAAAGTPADPARVPYYLLIVGGPDEIPFEFQYRLDVQYAVGRIHFDRPEDYASYARSVVDHESTWGGRSQEVTFFGVRNDDDRATELSEQALVRPLAHNLRQRSYGWDVSTVPPEEAGKARLQRLLGGDAMPSLLFTASHGLGFPHGHPRQLGEQGGLLCGDWPGPLKSNGPVPREHFLSAGDISEDADLRGLVAFFFACYGAGTPRFDGFSHRRPGPPVSLAPAPFVARLPQRLLSHPRGGALAVISHVDRAWGCSFLWGGAGSQPQAFEDTLRRLMKGYRVGAAVEKLNQRYAELAVDLTSEIDRDRLHRLEELRARLPPSPLAAPAAGNGSDGLARLWTAHNDARSYMVLGDPAVRLCEFDAEGRDAE